MRKVIVAALLCLAMLIAVMPARSGPIQFGHTWGMGEDEIAYAVEVDSSGNVYLSGRSVGLENQVFVAKVNILGEKMWDILLSSPTCYLYHVDSALGPSDSLYVVGEYSGRFSDDAGTFYAKIDSSGSLVYQKYLPGLDTPNRICTNSAGNGFVIVGDTTYYGTGAVVAVKDDGSVSWAQSADSPDEESPWAVVTDSSGAVYTFLDSSYDSNVAIAKFSKTGRLIRQSVLLTDFPELEYTWDMAIGHDGNIYALGANYGSGELLLASFTPKLDLIWDEYIGTRTEGYEATRLVVASDGSLCAIGYTTFTSGTPYGPAVFRIATSGVVLEATFYETDMFYGSFSMNDAALYPSGGILVAGSSYGFPKMTPVSIGGYTVTDIPVPWAADNIDWSRLNLATSPGDMVLQDVDGMMDNYEVDQRSQAWYGLMDPPPPAFKSSIAVKTTQNPYVFSFRASASGGHQPYAYQWYFGDGYKASGQKAAHEYGLGGTFQVFLVVTDANGKISWATSLVSIPAPPVITGVSHSPDPAYVGDTIFFEVFAYDPDGGPLTYYWDFGDGSGMPTSEPTASHTYWAQGTYDCWVTVTDDENSAVSTLISVWVLPQSNLPPIASFYYTPANPTAGEVVKFDGSPSYDPDGWIVSYEWMIENVTSQTGVVAYHTFSSPGSYLVGLGVMDNMGGYGYLQMWVTIQPSEPPNMVFKETFDSWSALDPSWIFWNSTNPLYNYVTIDDGTLMMSEYGTQLVDDSLQAMALWRSLVQYNDTLTVSFSLYLPLNHDEKYGYYGQSVYFSLLSPGQAQNLSAVPGINTRFLMDTWTGAPNGWSFANANGTLQKICDFEAGWHSASVTMRKGFPYWDATFDGVVYSGLTYSSPGMTGYDLGAIRIDNGLREEVVTARVDNLVVQLNFVPTPPPTAHISSIITIGPTIWVDASSSTAPAGIASYTWYWGDGSPAETFTTPHASHTYSSGNLSGVAGFVGTSAEPMVGKGPSPFPYVVLGYIYTINGTPVAGCNVLVANLRTGDTANTTSDSSGFYQYDLTLMQNGYMDGDVIQVLAMKGELSGVANGTVDLNTAFTWIDIIVQPGGPGVYYTVTLVVTDNLGQTDSISMGVWVRVQ